MELLICKNPEVFWVETITDTYQKPKNTMTVSQSLLWNISICTPNYSPFYRHTIESPYCQLYHKSLNQTVPDS